MGEGKLDHKEEAKLRDWYREEFQFSSIFVYSSWSLPSLIFEDENKEVKLKPREYANPKVPFLLAIVSPLSYLQN